MRSFSLAQRVALVFFFCSCACAHTVEPASEVVLVRRAPRCEEIGVIYGEGGGAATAIDEAKRRAAERGATHMMLETPEPDLEEGLTMVAKGTIFACPVPGSQFPATGYR